MMVTIVICGSATFKAAALQHINSLHKYLLSIQNTMIDVVVVNSEAPITIPLIHSGYFMPHELGLNDVDALLSRYAVGQSNLKIRKVALRDLGQSVGSTNYILVDPSNAFSVCMIAPLIKGSYYNRRNNTFITVHSNHISIGEITEHVSDAGDDYSLMLCAVIKEIQRAISNKSNITSFTLSMAM